MKKWKERKKEIGTKNHKKVDGKLLRTDKQFRHLKQRQKETISTWLYEEYRRLWIEKGQEPHKHNNWKIVAAVMERIEAAGIWLPEQIFLPQENPLPEPDRKRITAEAGNAG